MRSLLPAAALILISLALPAQARTLREMVQLAGPQDGYDKYVVLETGEIYSGGLQIGPSLVPFTGIFHGEPGYDVRIVGNGAVLDLEGQRLCISYCNNRLDLDDNTLVIFTADNGHCSYTPMKSLLDAGHRPSQRLRGYKADIWEGGHRVPFIVRWPGQVQPAAQCDQLICLTDLLASCAGLLGTRLPDNAGEDSVSILPALRGTAAGPLREAVVHHSWDGRFSVRQGKWKLILCPGAGGFGSKPSDAEALKLGLPPVQLYDMSQDDRETTNVQDQHPEIVERLTALLDRYVADGRSTPGAAQKNDVAVDIRKDGAKARSR